MHAARPAAVSAAVTAREQEMQRMRSRAQGARRWGAALTSLTKTALMFAIVCGSLEAMAMEGECGGQRFQVGRGAPPEDCSAVGEGSRRERRPSRKTKMKTLRKEKQRMRGARRRRGAKSQLLPD